MASSLILKRASASRPSGEWNDDDFDVLADGVVVGRIMKAAAVSVGQSWMWTLSFEHHEDRTATRRRARPPWQRSPRAGGGSRVQLRGLARLGRSSTRWAVEYSTSKFTRG